MAPPKELQLAQILADLNDLLVADPAASLALVTANKNLNKTLRRKRSKTPIFLPEAAKFDKLGRRIVPPATMTPASLPRNDSTASSGTQSPKKGEDDPDLERSRTLLGLYEVRGKFKNQENAGLTQARTSVEAVEERYNRSSQDDTRRSRSRLHV